MGLYLGSSKKLKINLNNVKYYLNFYSSSFITNGSVLLSKEGYVLKDCNGLYLTTITKEGE